MPTKFNGEIPLDTKKILIIGLALVAVVSCTCGVPFKVTAIQRSDKKLSCKDVILEVNEAEHYRAMAGKERGVGMGEMMMPLCWVSGFVDSEKAIDSANERIKYLSEVYDLLDCGRQMPRPPAFANIPRVQQPAPQPRPIIMQVPAPQPMPPSDAFAGGRDGRDGLDGNDGKGAPYIEMERGDAHYKLLEDAGPRQWHEHKDRNGKVYIHSHPHKGPHRHLEDEPGLVQ